MAATNTPPPVRLPQKQTSVLNGSVPEGCQLFRFKELEFVPWNNSDNIVSQKAEMVSRDVRLVLMQAALFLGGPANVINMAVFFKQGLKDRVNLLLFSLSLADEVFLVSCNLLYGEELYLHWDVGHTESGPVLKFMVNNNLGCFLSCCFVSYILSAIIACERCYCVLSPLRYHTLMPTTTTAFIIIAVYVVIISLNYIAVFRYYVACAYNPQTGVVADVWGHSEFYVEHKDLVDYVDNIFFGAGLPVTMAVVVVAATAITISRLRRAMTWRSETSASVSHKEVGLTKMLIGTSVLLIVCLCPSCVFRVACLFLPEVNSGRRNQNFYWMGLWVTEMFLFVNSSCNICVYYVMGSRYRETFWTLFRRK
ncbi:hypothetical protein ACOMHN_044060 [Nucella lapillus]